MADRDQNELLSAANLNRRGLLKCMTWAGTGVALDRQRRRAAHAWPDRRSCGRRDAGGCAYFCADQRQPYRLPPAAQPRPARHTRRGDRQDQGDADASRLFSSTPATSATCRRKRNGTTPIRSIKAVNKQVFFHPGEHDVADADNGKAYLDRYGKDTQRQGLVQLRHGGVHFIALINVFEFQARLQIRRSRQARRRAARMAGKGRRRALGEHADRRPGASAVVDDLRAVGLGHRRMPAARSAI